MSTLNITNASESAIFTEGPFNDEKLAPKGVYHRVSEQDPEETRRSLNFKSDAPTTIVNRQTTDGHTVCVVHSKPAWYTSEGKDFKIIDLVVEGTPGESDDSVMSRYKAQVELAKEYGEMARQYVNREVIPVLSDIKGVECILGRGDIYDKERVPTVDYKHSSDIDLMLFIDGATDASEVLQKFTEAHPETIFIYHHYNIDAHGFRGEQQVISAHKIDDPIVISIDVLGIDDLLGFAEQHPDLIAHLASPYIKHSLDAGSALLKEDTTGRFEQLKQLKQVVFKDEAADAPTPKDQASISVSG